MDPFASFDQSQMQQLPFGSTGINLAFIILELQLDVTGDAASACTHG